MPKKLPVLTVFGCRFHQEFEIELLKVVALYCKVSVKEIKSPTRGLINVAVARQIYAYILHTVAQYTMTNAGQVIGRNRTTIRHACACVENMRDRRQYRHIMDAIEEQTIELIRKHKGNQ